MRDKHLHFNFVSFTFYLLLAAGVYGTWKYVPIFWKRNQLQDIMQAQSYRVKRTPIEEVRKSIVEDARASLGIKLNPDEVEIEKMTDRVRIHVVWHIDVVHPFNKVTSHAFQVNQESIFF